MKRSELTPAMMRAIEYIAQCSQRGLPRTIHRPSPAVLRSLVAERFATRLESDESAREPAFALTDMGSAVLEAYRLGQRRWGAQGR